MRALLVLLALARIAHAEAPIVKAPDGWRETPELAKNLAAKLDELSHFGGAKSLSTVRMYVPPGAVGPQGQPLVVLVVAAVAGEVTADREVAARAAVDEVRRGDAASWEENVDQAKKQVEAWQTRDDDATQTKSVSHVVIAATADRMVSVSGECIETTDVASPKSEGTKTAQLVAVCRKALETLDPGLDPAQRVDLALAPAGTETPVPSGRQLPSMSEGKRPSIPPVTLSQPERTTDLRPVYVGLGLVVLAALFWWNRRRRARLEGKAK